MNTWQERFSKKVDTARAAASARFEKVAGESINSVFAEFQQFTAQQGLRSESPMKKKGLRTFKFSISENTYVLLTIRMAGIEHCDAQSEFYVPGHDKLPPRTERIELGNVDDASIRNVFEGALDDLLDAYLQTLQGAEVIQGELVGAGSK